MPFRDRLASATERARPALETGRAVAKRVRAHRTSVVAGGVAFFLLLALVPAMIAAVSLFGLVVSPGEVTSTLEPVTDAMPEDAANLVDDQLARVARTGGAGLTVGAVLSLLVALWAMSSGVKALIGAVNLAHESRDRRSFLRLRGLALSLALLALGGLALLVLLEILTVEIGGGFRRAYGLVRLLVFAFGAVVWLAVLYRLGPRERERERWRIVSGGALVAVVLAAVAVFGFTFYVANFGSYNETYGTLGAVVVLMMLLFVMSFAIVIGAEVDAELDERKAAIDAPADGDETLYVDAEVRMREAVAHRGEMP